MSRWLVVPLFMLGIVFPCLSSESQVTANRITGACERYLKQNDPLSICPTMLRAVFEGHLQGAVAYGLLNKIEKYNDLPFVWCPSNRREVTNTQLANIFLKYAHDHPESLDREATNVIVTAFMAAWPCTK